MNISLCCSSSEHSSLIFPHRMTKPLHSKISIDASEHPRLGWAWRSSAELDGRRSMFEDPARDRGWFAADPALPTQPSKIQVRISLSPCQWVLDFVLCFCFSSPIGKTHFCLELVCCWDGALVYNPNIDAVHCRNL